MPNETSTLNPPSTQTKSEDQVWYRWAILLTLSLIWGSSYILIKKGLVSFSPVQLATLRVSISGLAFLPLVWKHWPRFRREKLKYIAVVGLSGSFIPAFMFAFAQTEISSAVTGILSSLTPLFTLLLGLLFFRLPFQWGKIVGVLLGLSGASLLILLGDGELGGNPWYGMFVVIGSLCYALSANTVKVGLQDMPALTISVFSFILIGIPGWLYFPFSGIPETLAQTEGAWLALGYVVLLALFSTVLASILYFKLVQITNAVFATMVSYLIPIVALGWGIMDGETVSLLHMSGMGLILAGLYVARR